MFSGMSLAWFERRVVLFGFKVFTHKRFPETALDEDELVHEFVIGILEKMTAVITSVSVPLFSVENMLTHTNSDGG